MVLAGRKPGERSGDDAMSVRATYVPNPRRKSRTWAGLFSLTALLLVAAPAVAETPFATAVLYELTEEINCNPGPEGSFPTMPADCSNAMSNGFGTRIADAYLKGQVWGPPDSPFNGEIETEAASILSKVDWTGPAHGKLRVNNGTVHAVFSGQLNLAMAILWGKPLAPISGTWTGTKGTLRGGGRIEGVFLIPFPGAAVGRPEPWVYLALDEAGRPSGEITPLREGSCLDPDAAARGDYHNGSPMVKLMVVFYRS
jgi:hypothetical protein